MSGTAVVVRAVLSGAIVLGGLGSVSAQFTLDLTAWPPETEVDDRRALEDVPEAERLPAASLLLPNNVWIEGPLRISLVALDAAAYTLADPVVYDVVVENVGPAPFDFPQSVHQSQFRRGMKAARSATIALYFEEPGKLHNLAVRHLFGSSDVPGSFLRLDPGQSVFLRVNATWEPPGSPSVFPSTWQTSRLRLGSTVIVSNISPNYVPVNSTKTQTVQLSR